MSDGPFEARVETGEDKGNRNRRYGPKGRSFGAHLAAFQVAHHLWDASDTEPLRPTFALFVCSRESSKAFLMNLRKGRTLRIEGMGWSNNGGHPMEFLKSVGFVFHESEGMTDEAEPQPIVRIEVVLKHLYEFVPGMTDDMVSFVLALPAQRLRSESMMLNTPDRLREVDRVIATYTERGLKREPYAVPPFERETLIAEGLRFAASIDKRSSIPLPTSPVFCARLLLSALHLGHAIRDERDRLDLGYSPSSDDRVKRRFVEVGMHRAKRAPGLACKIPDVQLEEWIAGVIREHDNVRGSLTL